MNVVLTPVRLFPVPGVRRNGDAWRELRRLIGAPPAGTLQFATRRSRLDELRPGEKLLLTRKYGGVGDILISSMIFPMLADQYPGIRVTYACPQMYHQLFDGTGVALVAYEQIWSRLEQLAGHYDLIEDLSVPCHIWENFFVSHGGIDGGTGVRWRNRLDMWARWFGLQVVNPRTNIRISEQEKAEARQHLRDALGSDRPVCLLSPIAYSGRKNYPWFRQLAGRLAEAGFAVALLHHKPISADLPTLHGLSLRMMGAVCAVADLLVSVDSAAFHWGGILGRPTVGIFNINDGATYCRYYPTARSVQTCATPCINTRYTERPACPSHTQEALPAMSGLSFSRCYHQNSVDQVMEAVRALTREGNGGPVTAS